MISSKFRVQREGQLQRTGGWRAIADWAHQRYGQDGVHLTRIAAQSTRRAKTFHAVLAPNCHRKDDHDNALLYFGESSPSHAK